MLPMVIPDRNFCVLVLLGVCVVVEQYILQQLWLNDTSHNESVQRSE